MSNDYYIIHADGTRTGPCAEEEILDLLESGTLHPDDQCLHEESGRISPAGEMFHVINPVPEPAPAAVPWQPAPFPDDFQTKGPLPDKPRARLLYRGSPCVLTYWRSVLFTAAVIIAGCELNRRFPGIMALGLIIGPLILLRAVLHRLRTLYLITSVRVEVIEGLLSRSSRELRIADIRAINVTRTGITGLCGIGSITFSSAAGGDDDVVFHRVFGATGLKNLVRRLQDGAGVNSKP